jgi:hypothetical protein
VTLAQDLTCANGIGPQIDANNITVSLGGHSITCDTVENDGHGCIQAGTFENGALNNPTNTTIENGNIVSYGTAVEFFSVSTGYIEGLDITGGNADCSILISGSQNVRIMNNTITNCEILIDGSDHVWVTGNTLTNSPVLQTGSQNVVVSN